MTLKTKGAAKLRHLPDPYLSCRDVGHAWFEDDALLRPDTGQYVGTVGRVAQCGRCNTQRIDWLFRSSGDLAYRQYVYPTGYQIGRVKVAQVRKERLRRWR